MESLSLFKNFKERQLFFIIIFFLFLFNLYLEFNQYKKLTENEVFHANGTIVNIYKKSDTSTLKIKTTNFTFFTKYHSNTNPLLFQNVDLFIISKNISFYSYLKGFYTNSFNVNIYPSKLSMKENIYNNIKSQHINNDITSLYSALFLASPLTTNVRELASKLGISHLIAISGFHLGIISLVLYFIIHFLYNKLHKKYLPYRNKRFDIMIIVSIILFCYVIFLDIPASLLRAFIMFIFALFLLRNNIKIISFETLFIISIFIITLFPKLLLSLSLWFSIAGVFYIFLFIKYFNNLNKFIQFIFFNIWIYLAINPITHYFFATTSLEQLYSPVLSILFSIFYPLTIILHVFDIGSTLDGLLENVLNIDIDSLEIFTEFWFLLLYIFVSFISTMKKKAFILLNILIIIYNIWLFHFIF